MFFDLSSFRNKGKSIMDCQVKSYKPKISTNEAIAKEDGSKSSFST